MVTQILKTSLLMKQEETLILRESDKGNQIQFIFNDLSSITSAEFRLIKPDETFVISTGEINTDNNMITFDIDEQCCTVPGKGRFNIRLIGTDISVYTYVGRCIIDINLDLENAVESTAESNGYTFPDDFLTSDDLSNYASKNYVDTAVSHLASKNYVDSAVSNIKTGINYSTDEQDTGLRWVDGKHIFQKSIYLNGAYNLSTSAITIATSYFDVTIVDTFINALAVRKTHPNAGSCVTHASAWKDGANFKVYGSTTVNNIDYITVQYTKSY